MANLLVIHGPNINLLGSREPSTYGEIDLNTINSSLAAQAQNSGHNLRHFQSNAEHGIVNAIQKAKQVKIDFIIINPAAYTHTSIAIRDALLAVSIPFIEVHISNIYAREEFRHCSYLSDIAAGCIVGLGAYGYQLALQAATHFLKTRH